MVDIARLEIQADSRSVKTASKNLGEFDKSAGLAGAALSRLAPLVTAFFSGKALVGLANQAMAFNTAMAEVNTLLADSNELVKLNEEAKALAATFGGSPTAQAQAFYQAISAGAGNAEEATALLTAANKLAIGGVTDVTTAVDGLTSITNAYGIETAKASTVSDAFFVAMRAGKTTVGELSGSIGKVAATAATAGLSFEETLGSISALTTQGIATTEAVTGLKATLSNILKPSKEASDAAEQLGVDFSLTGLQSKGLAGFLDELVTATGGNEEAMLKLFGSTEALNTVFALTGGAAGTFDQIMQDMANSAGQTDTAFAKVSDTMSQKLSVLQGKFAATGVELGNFILTASEPFVDALNANFDDYVNYFKALGKATSTALSGLIAIWAPWAKDIANIIGNVFSYFVDLFKPAVEAWGNMLKLFHRAWMNFAGTFVRNAEIAIRRFINYFRNGFLSAREFVELTRTRIIAFYDTIVARAQALFESSETTERRLQEIDRQRRESIESITGRYDEQRAATIAISEQSEITDGVFQALGDTVGVLKTTFGEYKTATTNLVTESGNLDTELDNIDTGMRDIDQIGTDITGTNGALTRTTTGMDNLATSTTNATNTIVGPNGLTLAQQTFKTAVENTQSAWATLISDTITKGKTDFGSFFTTIKNGFAKMVSEIAAQNITNAIFGNGGISGFLSSLSNGFGGIIQTIGNGLGGIVSTFTSGLSGAAGGSVGGAAGGAAGGAGIGAGVGAAIGSAAAGIGNFIGGVTGSAVGASATLVGPPTAATAAGMSVGGAFSAIGGAIAGAAKGALAFATSPIGIAILAAAALAKVLDSGGTPTSKGGFLNYLVPGAPAGSTFNIAPFASGFAPVGFSEIMNRNEAITYIDAFRAVDSELTAFAKSQGLQVALNSNDFGGYNTEGEGGPNAGVFWGLAREKGRMGTALNTQLQEYTNDWLIAVAGKNNVPNDVLQGVLQSNQVADFVAGITSQRMGLNDVPVDNMIAKLHRGERVMTAGRADMTDQLAEEMKVMRSDFNQLMIQVAKATTRTARIEDRWDKNGLPPTRT